MMKPLEYSFNKLCKLSLKVCVILLSSINMCWAAKPIFEITISNHLFYPSTVTIPANTKVKLVVTNKDSTPEEFESYELNREKVVLGGQQAIIFIGPLKAGEYPFFGEFHPNTAVGKILVE